MQNAHERFGSLEFIKRTKYPVSFNPIPSRGPHRKFLFPRAATSAQEARTEYTIHL
jgi:hypothetical protein